MEKDNSIKIEYNLAQLFFIMSRVLIKIAEWGRGTGKSTILSKQIIDCVTLLPRSTGVMVAETYAQIKTRTLPSTIAGLELHGWIKDVHYFVGGKPPKSWNWPEPYEPPLDYSHCVYFYTGAVMIFISQDGGAASGRGLNVDWVVGDEAARLDEDLFNTDVLLTNRGNERRIAKYPDGTWSFFGEVYCHHSITLLTSTPITAKGRWIFKFEERALFEPNKCNFFRASAEINRKNLGSDYFDNAKATMPDFLYQAEVENKRISKIEDGFYPLLDETKHTYTQFDNNYYKEFKQGEANSLGDADCNRNAPLIAGIDWGARINCLLTCQKDDAANELKVLKNFYVKSPQIIDDLVDKFAKYYEHHSLKEIYLWYDPSGNNNTANARKTYAEQVRDRLISLGWKVQLLTTWRQQEEHTTKFRLWNNILKEENTSFPKFRLNRSNCPELWVSMTNAPAKQGYNEMIKKDKSSENKKGFAQEHATHFSDAMDVVVVGMFLHIQFNKPDTTSVVIR